MNPDTRRLELVESQQSAMKEISRPPSAPERRKNVLELIQIPDLQKSAWTTFKIGEQVEVARTQKGPAHSLRVHNIHADGLLLRGKNLTRFYAGQQLFVKGEKCKVVRISSKGLYVRGA